MIIRIRGKLVRWRKGDKENIFIGNIYGDTIHGHVDGAALIIEATNVDKFSLGELIYLRHGDEAQDVYYAWYVDEVKTGDKQGELFDGSKK